MAVLVTLALFVFLVLCALIALLTWLLLKSQRRYDALHDRFIAASDAYAGTAIRNAADIARNQPKYADKMLDSLADGLTRITEGLTSSMKAAMTAVYGPVQRAEAQAAATLGDLPTPWYATEGAMDFTDPTDLFLGGIADPAADNQQAAGGNLLLEDGPAGFGLPEGAFD